MKIIIRINQSIRVNTILTQKDTAIYACDNIGFWIIFCNLFLDWINLFKPFQFLCLIFLTRLHVVVLLENIYKMTSGHELYATNLLVELGSPSNQMIIYSQIDVIQLCVPSWTCLIQDHQKGFLYHWNTLQLLLFKEMSSDNILSNRMIFWGHNLGDF